MLTPKQVADFFLISSDEEVGDLISNLKLQKLVYYAQGFHLAMYGTPLFEDPILAWEHGPVVEKLYHEFKQYGSGAIPKPKEIDITAYTKSELELLTEVYDVYGQFSAWKLRNMTHSESPWINTPKNTAIDPKLMQDFFQTLLLN